MVQQKFNFAVVVAQKIANPIEVTTEEMVNTIHDMVLDDHRVKVCETNNSTFNITYELSDIKKLSEQGIKSGIA